MAQPQQVNLKIKGLYTAASDFTGVPDGALDEADDIVIDHENLAESRRGFDLHSSFPDADDRANRFTTYQDHKISQFGTDSLAYYSSSWSLYSGTYAAPDTDLAKVRFYEANQNLYISTSTGVKKLDAYNGTPVSAGIPKGLDLQVSLTGSSGFFGTNTVLTTTGTVTNSSAGISLLTSTSGIAANQYVYGTNVPSGTTVSSLTTSATVSSGSVTTAIGSTTISAINATTGFEATLVAGQFITGTGIPANARIVSVNTGAHTAVISSAATAAGTITATIASDPIVTMSASATSTASVTLTFSSGSQVAYRGLFGYRDANNNLLYGAPSQYTAITNTTGTTSNTLVTMSIPSGITVNHFYQIYRSAQTATASVTPIDDMQLVYEGNPTSGDLSNGYVQITDSTPDSLRGAFLYTGVGQEGILQENDPPPFCKDFCTFKGFSLYANTKSKQRKKLTILAVGGSNGIAATDTLIISGITFTADTSETASTGHFKVYTTGSASQNITDTANSLIKVINRYATNTATYAYLLSGPADLPGQILLEERSFGGSAFAITASAHGSAYSPVLPTSGTTVISAQDINKHGIIISKENEPESAPESNLLFAGSASKEILRVIPLREYVVILKQDGIFRFTGTSLSTFVISPFDLTTKLIAPDSAVSLSNEVWGLFDQGICSVSDTGVNVRSRPIETNIRALIGTAIDTIRHVAFGVGYETDRKYILALPDNDGDEACHKEYIFNTFTNAWFRWTRVVTAGFIDGSEDKLYFGSGEDETVFGERKNGNYTDYVDESFDATISSSSSYTVILTDTSGIEVGDVLFQDSSHFSIITEIDTVTNTLTVNDLITWSNGAASILPAINNVIQWKPIVGGNPVFVRQYSEGAVVFKRTRFNTGDIAFYSDISQSFESTDITGFTLALWGLFPWGSQPWGGLNRPRSVRFIVPQNKQVCSQLSARLTIRSGYSNWASEGVSLSFNPMSQEIN